MYGVQVFQSTLQLFDVTQSGKISLDLVELTVSLVPVFEVLMFENAIRVCVSALVIERW